MHHLLTAYVPSKAALRAYTSGDYVVPRTRLKLGVKSFLRCCAIGLEPPAKLVTLKLVRCTDTFKRKLKTVCV